MTMGHHTVVKNCKIIFDLKIRSCIHELYLVCRCLAEIDLSKPLRPEGKVLMRCSQCKSFVRWAYG